MRPTLRYALLVALALGTLALADEAVQLGISEYKKRKLESVSREAYGRALERCKKTRLGMRTDEFFETMEMLIVRDKKGQGIDGFVEGYLQKESLEASEDRKPASVLIFGWYENWKERKKPVRRFTIVFRDKVFQELSFDAPADDWRASAKAAAAEATP